MKTILESLIKKSFLYLELKEAKAPEVILQTEEKFLNERMGQFQKQLQSIVEELESAELEELNRCSPCYTCKNATRELSKGYKPLECVKRHLMDDNNIEERIDSGCSDFDKIEAFPNYIESQTKIIQKKYSKENLKDVLKLICEKLKAMK